MSDPTLTSDSPSPSCSDPPSDHEPAPQSQSPPALSPAPSPSPTKRKVRHVTLYDAVAGRISTSHSLRHHHRSSPRPHLRVSTHRDTTSTSLVPLPPDEVLFRRRRAPVRYAETGDWYFADLPAGATLPDGDLLGALHGYVSDFYARNDGGGGGGGSGGGDWRSLDESALLACGVLLEEAVRGVLGRRGEGVFLEGRGDGRTEGDGEGRRGRKKRRRMG